MYNAFWWHALFVRGQSFSVKTFDRSRNGCQVIEEGAGNDFRGVPSPLACLLLARTFFLLPTTSKRLLRRIRRLSAVQIRGVSRTSAITAKFANFDQKKCKPSLQTKKGRNFGAFIVLKCRRIFRNLGEESKRKFVM